MYPLLQSIFIYYWPSIEIKRGAMWPVSSNDVASFQSGQTIVIGANSLSLSIAYQIWLHWQSVKLGFETIIPTLPFQEFSFNVYTIVKDLKSIYFVPTFLCFYDNIMSCLFNLHLDWYLHNFYISATGYILGRIRCRQDTDWTGNSRRKKCCLPIQK